MKEPRDLFISTGRFTAMKSLICRTSYHPCSTQIIVVVFVFVPPGSLIEFTGNPGRVP
jgi:hypothetical protein